MRWYKRIYYALMARLDYFFHREHCMVCHKRIKYRERSADYFEWCNIDSEGRIHRGNCEEQYMAYWERFVTKPQEHLRQEHVKNIKWWLNLLNQSQIEELKKLLTTFLSQEKTALKVQQQ